VLLRKWLRFSLPHKREDLATEILKKQLKEAHDEIVKLREENKHMKRRIAEYLDLCEEALENGKIMVTRSLRLHKQMKNIYKKNKVLKTK
jgi:regulator of replication initiation timing